MKPAARGLAGFFAALTSVVLLVGMASSLPKRAKEFQQWITTGGQLCNDSTSEFIRILPASLEWNGRVVTQVELNAGLDKAMQNRAERTAFIDADDNVAFLAVGQVMDLLKRLHVRTTMLHTSADRVNCRQAMLAGRVAVLRRDTVASRAVQFVPWWRFW